MMNRRVRSIGGSAGAIDRFAAESRPNHNLDQLHTVGTFSPSALLFASCLREISADWQNRSAQRLKKCAALRGRFGFARIETAS